MEKSYRKFAPNASPDLFLILLNNPKQPQYTRISLKNILKEDCQKAVKNLALFFLLNPVPFKDTTNRKKAETAKKKQNRRNYTRKQSEKEGQEEREQKFNEDVHKPMKSLIRPQSS